MNLKIYNSKEFITYMKAYEFNRFSDQALLSIYEYLNERDIFNDLAIDPNTIYEVFEEYHDLNNKVVILYVGSGYRSCQ